jgi:Carboxypeptidase regulatory-like domain
VSIAVTPVTSQGNHARAQETARHIGHGIDALPGVHEVPLAGPNVEGLNARLGLGYGWTESVLKMDDTHHRLQVDAAGSLTPLPWFATSLRVLGRYDTHSGGVSDDGTITETHLGLRATFPLDTDWHAGGELSFWLPGGDSVGKAFSAVSGDALLLLTYAPELSPISVGLALGLRVDRSKFAGGDPKDYSAADRLSLGASDAIFAARQGLAFTYTLGELEWIAEWAFRMYFDHVAESPMWIRAGARYRPARELQLELLLGVSPSSRPSVTRNAPLAVIEPRLAAGLSLTYAWPSQPSAAEAPAPPKLELQAPPEKPRADVRGQVLTASGTGLAGATVTLSRNEVRQTSVTDPQGAFVFTSLSPGTYTLELSAEGFTPERQTIEVSQGATAELAPVQVTLKRELPQGQIRGTVRRFNGTPVVATVSIPALKLTLTTRDDGTFEIDVPPGEYSVSVKARGLRPQTRKASVELHGVAILIVELEGGK